MRAHALGMQLVKPLPSNKNKNKTEARFSRFSDQVIRHSRQDFVAEAVASRKSVGSWELFVGT
jgi:hypothetical protein